MICLLGLKNIPRETENNGYAKFWLGRGEDKKIIMVFSKVGNDILIAQHHVYSPWTTRLPEMVNPAMTCA